MIYFSPYEKRRRRALRLRTGAIILGAFILLTALDIPLAHLFYSSATRQIENHDWYRALRILGFFPLWIVIGAIFILQDRSRHRGLAIIFAPLLAGALAELIKPIVARERPVGHDTSLQPGFYHFRGLFDGFIHHTNGLGFPSSHAAVAFGGTLMLAAFLPRARTLLIILAVGCGVTRMLTGAHFASDVFAGALLGWASATLLTRCAAVHVPTLRPRFRIPR